MISNPLDMHVECVLLWLNVYQLVHRSRRGLTGWAGATKCTLECYAELLPGPGEFGVELVSIAAWQETVYSLGSEDMGVVVKLNKWIKNR